MINKRKAKIAGLLLAGLIVMGGSTGCVRKPYHEADLQTIKTNESAIVVSLIDTGNQDVFKSKDLLEKAIVPTKEYEVAYRFKETGRLPNQGKWIPKERLIRVDRTTVTREWTSDSRTGTNSNNEGIIAESKDSITYVTGINCGANIKTQDFVDYLYNYGERPLSDVMDKEIRPEVESVIAEFSATADYKELVGMKNEMMKFLNEKVISKFKGKGVTITTLGLKGGFTPIDKEIQNAINSEFTEQKLLDASTKANERKVAEAEADAKVLELQKSIMKDKILLLEAEAKKIMAEAELAKGNNWNPSVIGSGSTIVDSRK